MSRSYHYVREVGHTTRDGTKKLYLCPIEINYTPCETSELRKAHASLRRSIMLLTEEQLNYYCTVLNKPIDTTVIKRRSALRKSISNLTMEHLQHLQPALLQ
jgi:hypothetical protein